MSKLTIVEPLASLTIYSRWGTQVCSNKISQSDVEQNPAVPIKLQADLNVRRNVIPLHFCIESTGTIIWMGNSYFKLRLPDSEEENNVPL